MAGQNMQIEGQVLTQVNKFKYLDSTFANNRLDVKLDAQTSNASKAIGRLRNQVYLTKYLSIKTKFAVNHTIVLSTQQCRNLDGVQSWCLKT